MIPTKNQAIPAAKVIDSIQQRAGALKARFAQVNETSCSTQTLLSLVGIVTNAIEFFDQYAGDQRVIDYANNEAAQDVDYFGQGYDVTVDFIGMMTALNDIKLILESLDYTDAVYVLDGHLAWRAITATGIQSKIDSFNSFVD